MQYSRELVVTSKGSQELYNLLGVTLVWGVQERLKEKRYINTIRNATHPTSGKSVFCICSKLMVAILLLCPFIDVTRLTALCNVMFVFIVSPANYNTCLHWPAIIVETQCIAPLQLLRLYGVMCLQISPNCVIAKWLQMFFIFNYGVNLWHISFFLFNNIIYIIKQPFNFCL